MNFRENGVIRISNKPENNILTSQTFFSNSLSYDTGGSIYVIDGACIQYHVCSINSSSPSNYGCHSYVENKEENYIIECSITRCNGYCNSIDLRGGNQSIDSTNISYANCVYNPSYACWYNPNSNQLKANTIVNNSAEDQSILFHEHIDHFVSRCNIIQNELPSNSYGIIWSRNCNLYMELCSITKNKGPAIFYNEGKIVVSKCYISNNEAITSKLNSVNVETTSKLVLILSHLSTQSCDADIPLIYEIYGKPKINSSDLNLIGFLFASSLDIFYPY